MNAKLFLTLSDIKDADSDMSTAHSWGTYDEDDMYGRDIELLDSSFEHNSFGLNDEFDINNYKTAKIKVSEMECATDVTPVILDEKMASNKMALIKISINPDSIDEDAETELRFWFKDSKSLLDDYSMDDKTKLKHLPFVDMALSFENGGGLYQLQKCKMVQKYSNGNFYFCTLVEKIIRI